MQVTVRQIVDIKFRISNSHYGVTAKGEVYNLRTGRKLRRVVIGSTKGYCINGRFESLKKIRSKLIKIQKVEMPF